MSNQLSMDDVMFDQEKVLTDIRATSYAIINVETKRDFLELERDRQLDNLWKTISTIPQDKRKECMMALKKEIQACCIEAILKHIPELYIYGGDKNARKDRSEA